MREFVLNEYYRLQGEARVAAQLQERKKGGEDENSIRSRWTRRRRRRIVGRGDVANGAKAGRSSR